LTQLGESGRDQPLPQLGLGRRPDRRQRQEIPLSPCARQLCLDDTFGNRICGLPVFTATGF